MASYGRQLGRIVEALLAIAEHSDVSNYTGDQKTAVEDFEALMREIAEAKRTTSAPSIARHAPHGFECMARAG